MLRKNRFLQVCFAGFKWWLDDLMRPSSRMKLEIRRLDNRIAQLERDLKSLES